MATDLCPQCGARRQPGNRFCGSCAFDFEKVEGPSEPTVPGAEAPASASSASADGQPTGKSGPSWGRIALIALGVILVVVVIGYVAGQLDGSGAPVAGATGSEEPTATATAAATPRPTPPPTPEPAGLLEKTQEVVIAWQREFSDYVSYQVVLQVQNTGTGWAELSAFESDYTILGSDGSVVTTGLFTYEFPKFVGPGEFGYLIADGSDIGGGGSVIADYATVDISGRFDTVGSPGATFEVTDIALKAEAFGGGLVATGFVTPSQDVTDAAMAVICLGAQGQVLGGTWTNLLQNLTAGQPKGFETVGGTPPLQVSDCASVSGYASDTGF